MGCSGEAWRTRRRAVVAAVAGIAAGLGTCAARAQTFPQDARFDGDGPQPLCHAVDAVPEIEADCGVKGDEGRYPDGDCDPRYHAQQASHNDADLVGTLVVRA